MVFKSSTGPVKSNLDSVVDKLQEMNKDQTALQKESITYANELQDYIQNEGQNLTNQQIMAMQEMILALKEGRLDDIEAQKEELVRLRAEERRDEERNDFLKDTLKQLKLQYKLLLDALKEDKSTLLGLVFRTAVVGLLFGIVQGLLSPYINAIQKIGKQIAILGKDLFERLQLQKLFDKIGKGFGTLRASIVNFFSNTRLAKFFQGVSKESLGARFFAQFKLAIKDMATLGKNLIGFVKGLAFAFVGLFTGAPTAFKALAEAKIAFKPQGVVFQVLGAIVNFVKKPFVALLNKLKGAFTGISFGIAKFADNIGGFFTKDGKSTFFQKTANNLKTFFSKTGPLKIFFQFFAGIQNLFIRIGTFLGSKLLFPLFGLIGGIMGVIKDIKGSVSAGEKLIRGVSGFTRGVVRILIGEFLDFLKQAFGLILDIVTFGAFDLRKKFKEFSFADFFDSLFFAFADFWVETFHTIKDVIDDISIGGLIKNMLVMLGSIFTRILDFPVAVAKGAAAALFTRPLAGPEERIAKFNEAFQDHMNNSLTDRLMSQMVPFDGKNSEGEDIEYKSATMKRLEASATEMVGPIQQSVQSNFGGDSYNIGAGLMMGNNQAAMFTGLMLSGGTNFSTGN